MDTVMKYFLIVLFIVWTSAVHAQQASGTVAGKQPSQPSVPASRVYDAPETPAIFPYGKDSLNRFIAHSIKLGHVENGEGVTGKAIVIFIVEKDGSIGAAEILRTSGDKGFDDESVRIAKSMPKWSPAKDKGEVVRSSTMLTFSYRFK